MGIGGSSSSSKPKDMTPKAFKALQGPFASVFASLLGFGPPGGPSNGTGWGPDGKGGWVYNPAPIGQTPGVTTVPAATGQQFGGTGGRRGGFGSSGSAAHGNGGSAGGGSPTYRDRRRQQFQNRLRGNQPQPTTTIPQFATTGNPNDILNGIPQYQGPLTAGIGENEQAILDLLMGQANGQGSTQAGPSGEALDYLSRVMQGEFMGADPTTGSLTSFAQMLQGAAQTEGYSPDGNNPFVQAAIEAAQRPTIQALEETLSRTLPGRFTAAGQFKQPGGSSAFDRAAAIATRGASDTLGDIATNISFDAFEAERGRQFEAQEGARAREDQQLRGELDRIFQGQQGERDRMNEAAGLTSTVQAQEVDNLVKNLQAQALPRLIEEFGIERGLEQFNNRVNTLLATLGIAQGVTAPVIGQQSESKSAQLSLK